MTDDARRRRGIFGPGSEGMPPWIPRLLLQVFVLVVLFFVGRILVQELWGFLILIVISLFLATAFEPGVAYLARRGWKRGTATAAIFLVVAIVTGAFIGLMVPLVVDQTGLLIERIPTYAEDIETLGERLGLDLSQERLVEAFTTVEGSLETFATRIGGGLLGVGGRVIGTLFQLLTIGLFTFYMTADGPKLRRTVLSVLSPSRQREVIRVLDIAIDKTGGYFYSRALLAGVSGLVTWGVLAVIGIPFALPLGLWVGVLSQFVPVVGTYLGGILPVLIGLLESPARGVAVVAFIVIYQQVENYLISPRVTAHTMSLHPAVAFGSAIVGASLLGPVGALIALPAAATIQAFVSTYIDRHQVVDSPLVGQTGPVEV